MTWRDDLRALVEDVPRDELPDLAGELARGQAMLQTRIAAPPPGARAPQYADTEMINAVEAGRMLGVSRSWIYEHQDELGAKKMGGAVRFRVRRLRIYLERGSA